MANTIVVRSERTGHEARINPRALPGYRARGWDVKPDNKAKRRNKAPVSEPVVASDSVEENSSGGDKENN